LKVGKLLSEFVFEPPETVPVGSVLYQEHLKLTSKSALAEFAGFVMPLWYSSISAEHEAVRRAAGIFDCTHMGILEIAGADALRFLNCITTNDVENLKVGSVQYSYILDAAGNILDDIVIYRRTADKFMMVVNAANELKIKTYFEALKGGRAIIDTSEPSRKLEYTPVIRDMKNYHTAGDCRVDIALQGPAAKDVLFALTEDSEIREHIENLKYFRFIETSVRGIDCIISRTGYTGSKIGFELYVHPERAAQLWNMLLQNGKSFGLLPCGLGARDSLRIEAGLPLYGHELAGPFNISPFEAGYAWTVKLEKEFFVGKSAMQQMAKKYDMMVARVKLAGQRGIRPVRQNDAVLSKAGECIGWVLSCAKVGDEQLVTCYVGKKRIKENDPVGIYYLARSQRQLEQGKKRSVEKGQSLDADILGTTVSRFEKF